MEGIKEEVVLSPAHALSLIAAGEGKFSFFSFFVWENLQLIRWLNCTDSSFIPVVTFTK